MNQKNKLIFELEQDYIELNKLLKYLGLAESGAAAMQLTDAGCVKRNGKPEMRRRAKLRKGDRLEVNGIQIEIR